MHAIQIVQYWNGAMPHIKKKLKCFQPLYTLSTDTIQNMN